MRLVILNIKELVQTEELAVQFVAGKGMSELNTIKNAFLFIQDGLIHDFGPMQLFNSEQSFDILIDATDKMVFPCFCDSHTHIVFAGSREEEFVDKIRGLTYQEIYQKGGGILNSALLLHKTSENELTEMALERLEEVMLYGTGAIEIKSGYGLNFDDEIKMLKVINKLKQLSPLTIKATFLGAHAIPSEFKNFRKGYINLIIDKMLPAIAEQGIADYIDVFCDKSFFTLQETEEILLAAAGYGLIPKIHANELSFSGGVEAGVKYNALSVDHLEFTGENEIELLKSSSAMPTLLPGTSFFLGLKYPPARLMINSGLAVALASDYNPGSCPSGNMQMIMSLGCIKLKMLPEEVINAVTVNSAYAMGVVNNLGSIARGKKANVFITKKIPSYTFIPYSFGSNNVETLIINGRRI